MQSTTMLLAASALMTGSSPPTASDVPVERIGTGPFSSGERQHHMERPCLELMQREFGEAWQDRARLGFGENRDDLAFLDRAQPEDLDECLDPFAFNRFLKHRLCPQRLVGIARL